MARQARINGKNPVPSQNPIANAINQLVEQRGGALKTAQDAVAAAQKAIAAVQTIDAQLGGVNYDIASLPAIPGITPVAPATRGRGRPKGSRNANSGNERTARGTARVRPQNASTLPVALAQVLRGKTMGVTEAAEAVQKAGYRTTGENFRTIVNQALLKHSDLFRKVARGQYTAI